MGRGPDTARDHLVRNVATARADETVGEVRRRLFGHGFASLENVHVTDAAGRLIGLLPMTDLIAGQEDDRIGQGMTRTPATVSPEMDQEKVAAVARRYCEVAPPVVDRDGRLLGCVPPAALIEIGGREHAEDISRLAGILHQHERSRTALQGSPWRRARDRLPWLLVGLLGSAFATLVCAYFADRLSSTVAIAFFIPAIVYLADAVGTQTEAVVVRALASNTPSLASLLQGEASAGLIIGSALGLLALPLVYLGFGDLRLALAVGLAVSLAGGIATVCGLLLPWTLSRAGLDPAFGSGPVATVIQDVLTLIIYFSIVQAIVPVEGVRP